MKKSHVQKNKKGFTLIELIVVVAILAILAAIAVPNFIGMANRAKTATEIATAAEWVNAINIHNTLAKGDTTITAISDAAALAAEPVVLGDLKPTSDVLAPETYVFPRIQVVLGVASIKPTGKANLHS